VDSWCWQRGNRRLSQTVFQLLRKADCLVSLFSLRFKRRLRWSVLQQGSQLLAQFRAVRMSMCRNRVLSCRLKHFFFGALNPQRAAFLAGIESAVHRFSLCFGHESTLL